ncbi:hypothetical protein LBMAG42_11760 [Deltaproteobacteria bacterium]|nr:hypothetical protein LBMAG42_11760 [Deltaproteobacteria bacterium]
MEELDPSFPAPARRRFALKRLLASGGMGRVWLALDREWESLVAVKTANFRSAEAAVRMRAEFRSFARVHHENVVRLYELVGDDQSCCYSMEYVDGENFVRHVRGTLQDGQPLDGPGQARLLRATWQLVEGVEAIHAAKILHRDLKPDNVLVDGRGRVVIVDPGIAARLPGAHDTAPDTVIGTMAYMAPEQASGAPQGPGTDWYAVGVVLAEACVGTPPFTGSPLSVLNAKHSGTPPALTGIGEPWRGAITALLHKDPAARGDGVAVLRALAAAVVDTRSRLTRSLPFVGRDSELGRLTRAWERADAGRVVLIVGASGSGKSRLVEEWTSSLRGALGARVFAGRCDPRESVPFRGLDALEDQLTPHGPGRLRLTATTPTVDPIPSREARERAFAALRDRLLDEARRRPVVVWIDDAQWAGPDTLALLVDLARPPLPAGLLFVVTARADVELPAEIVALRLSLGALGESDARKVAATAGSPELAGQIAAASAGDPLLLSELCRAAARGGLPVGGDVRAVIAARLTELPPDARRVFEMIAVAGAPLSTPILRRAPVSDPLASLSILLAERLVRVDPSPTGVQVLPTHDSLAEACLAALDPLSREDRHRAVAAALEAAADPRSELVATHLELGGQPHAAARSFLRAARAAARAFAYRAATLAYERAFRLDPTLADREARVGQAEILAALGLRHRAAEAYLAAEGAQACAPLRVRAAEQYLLSSRIQAGAPLLAGVLAAQSIPSKEPGVSLLLSIAWAHVRLAAGWLPKATTADELHVLWVAAASLSPFQPLLSHWYGALYALRARAAADPSALARAASLEAILLARFRGTWFGRFAPERAQDALRLARLSPHPGDLAYAYVAEAAVHWSVCNAVEAIAAGEEALRRYDSVVSPTAHWEANVARLWLFAVYLLDEQHDKLMAMADLVERDAAEREDTWALDAGMFWATARTHLLRGRPERAAAAVNAVLARSESGGHNVGEILADMCQADVALSAGDFGGAWAAVLRGLPRRARHQAEIIPAIGSDYYFRRATIAAAVAAGRGDLPAATRTQAAGYARDDIGRIRRSGAVYARELSDLTALHGRVVRGDVAGVGDELERLAAAFEKSRHRFWAHAARALAMGAEGVRDSAWQAGLYVDIYLPGVVVAPGATPVSSR